MIYDRRRYAAAAALACLIVGGCERKVSEGTKATGEVLEGTISDAMIATDGVRSEPPLAPHTAKVADGKGEKAKGKAVDGDTPEPAPEVVDSLPGDAATPPKPAASEPAG